MPPLLRVEWSQVESMIGPDRPGYSEGVVSYSLPRLLATELLTGLLIPSCYSSDKSIICISIFLRTFPLLVGGRRVTAVLGMWKYSLSVDGGVRSLTILYTTIALGFHCRLARLLPLLFKRTCKCMLRGVVFFGGPRYVWREVTLRAV